MKLTVGQREKKVSASATKRARESISQGRPRSLGARAK